jgi:hypothetical protein
MGEKRQLESQMAALRRIGLAGALTLNTGGMLIVAAAGALLMFLVGGSGSLAWWGALGVLMCGVAGLVHLNLAILRLHAKAQDAQRRRESEARAARIEAWKAREPVARSQREAKASVDDESPGEALPRAGRPRRRAGQGPS